MRRFGLLSIGLISGLCPPALAQDLLCQDPAGFCRATLSKPCLTRLGAGVLSASGGGDVEACERQRSAYFDCVAEAAERCGVGRTEDGGCEAEDARLLFESAERAGDCLAYNAFVQACPGAIHASMAEAARARLGCGEHGLFKPYSAEDDGKPASKAGPAPDGETNYWSPLDTPDRAQDDETKIDQGYWGRFPAQ